MNQNQNSGGNPNHHNRSNNNRNHNPQNNNHNNSGNHANVGGGNQPKRDMNQKRDGQRSNFHRNNNSMNNSGNNGRNDNRNDNRNENRNDNRNDFHKKPQQPRYNSENYAARIVTPKREETIDDIKMDIEKLEKDIQFEIKQIRSVRLGL